VRAVNATLLFPPSLSFFMCTRQLAALSFFFPALSIRCQVVLPPPPPLSRPHLEPSLIFLINAGVKTARRLHRLPLFTPFPLPVVLGYPSRSRSPKEKGFSPFPPLRDLFFSPTVPKEDSIFLPSFSFFLDLSWSFSPGSTERKNDQRGPLPFFPFKPGAFWFFPPVRE